MSNMNQGGAMIFPMEEEEHKSPRHRTVSEPNIDTSGSGGDPDHESEQRPHSLTRQTEESKQDQKL